MNGWSRPALSLALAASLAAGAAWSSAASAQERFSPRRGSDREFDERARRADPGKVVAAELAFARTAREKGQWTAFAEFAADDAVMFVPEPVKAKDWLKKQRDPAESVRWQPHRVWSSCDGTLAVTKGAWQAADGSAGYFITVWERQRNGEYKWVMDQGDTLAQPLEEPEMIGTEVADCRSPATPPPVARVPGPGDSSGRSRDGTLAWSVIVEEDNSRSVEVRYWDGKNWQFAIAEQVAAP